MAFWFVEKYAMLLLVSAGFAAFSASLMQGMALGLGLLYRSNNSHFEWVRAFGSGWILGDLFWIPAFRR